MNANEAALFDAIKANNLSQVQALLKKKVNPNIVQEGGWTPLQIAALKGHEPAITALLAAGADVNQAMKDGSTPLHIAAQKGHAPAITALCEAGADVNQAAEGGATPLYIAAKKGHAPAITALLAAEADVNQAMKNDATPLYIAALNGHVSAITALLAAGADVNQADKRAWTPLFVAAENGHVAAITALLAAGAEVNKASGNGFTPLHAAALNGHVSAITALLAAGAEVNQANKNGATPLFIAAQFGREPAITALCAAGARVNLTMEGGWTPLHIAAHHGHVAAITALLKSPDINLSLKTRPGHEGWADKTALQIAQAAGHTEIVKLIEAKVQALAAVPNRPASSSSTDTPQTPATQAVDAQETAKRLAETEAQIASLQQAVIASGNAPANPPPYDFVAQQKRIEALELIASTTNTVNRQELEYTMHQERQAQHLARLEAFALQQNLMPYAQAFVCQLLALYTARLALSTGEVARDRSLGFTTLLLCLPGPLGEVSKAAADSWNDKKARRKLFAPTATFFIDMDHTQQLAWQLALERIARAPDTLLGQTTVTRNIKNRKLSALNTAMTRATSEYNQVDGKVSDNALAQLAHLDVLLLFKAIVEKTLIAPDKTLPLAQRLQTQLIDCLQLLLETDALEDDYHLPNLKALEQPVALSPLSSEQGASASSSTQDSNSLPAGVSDALSFNYAEMQAKIQAMEAAQAQERERREAAEELLAKLNEQLEAQPTPEELRRIQRRIEQQEQEELAREKGKHRRGEDAREDLLGKQAGPGGQVMLDARPENVERLKSVQLAVGENSEMLGAQQDVLITHDGKLEALESEVAHLRRVTARRWQDLVEVRQANKI